MVAAAVAPAAAARNPRLEMLVTITTLSFMPRFMKSKVNSY